MKFSGSIAHGIHTVVSTSGLENYKVLHRFCTGSRISQEVVLLSSDNGNSPKRQPELRIISIFCQLSDTQALGTWDYKVLPSVQHLNI